MTARRTACSICGAAQIGACCWKVDGYTLTEYGELALGDQIKRAREASAQAARPAAKVVGVERVWDDGIPTNRLEVQISINKRLKTIWVNDNSPVRVFTRDTGRCGARVCEAHGREVGDGHYHCSNHWRVWEQVA